MRDVSLDTFSRVLHELYGAALGRGDWESSLRSVAEVTGSTGAILGVLAEETGGSSFELANLDRDRVLSYYAGEGAANDPRMHALAGISRDQVYYDCSLFDEEFVQSSEVFNRAAEEYGVKYCMGARVRAGDFLSPITWYFTVQRTPEEGHVQAAEIRFMNLMLPHIAQAVRGASLLHSSEETLGALVAVLDRRPDGVLLVDGAGRVVLANRAARTIASKGDGVTFGAEGVGARRPPDAVRLGRLLDDALKTSVGEGAGAGGRMLVGRLNGSRPYVVSVAPLPAADPLFAPHGIRAVVYVSDPDLVRPLTAADMLQTYGLSEREAQIALALAAGEEIGAAASRLGIARNTARVHLRNIFHKTETRRQSELVRLISTLP